MFRTATKSPNPAYLPWVVAAFAVVIASFLGSTYYAETRLADVDRQTLSITRSTMPAVFHLAVLRTRLHDLETALIEATSAQPPEVPNLNAASRALAAIEGESGVYDSQPAAGRDRWAIVAQKLDVVRVVALDAMVALGRRNDDVARAAVETVRPAIVDADHGIAALIEADATGIERTAETLHAARVRVMTIAFGLDALCLVLSFGAVFVALQAVRRSAALAEERVREFEAFASRVAHDIRGPLTPVMYALQKGARTLDADAPLRKPFERALRSLGVVVSVVDGLFAFARSGARPEEGAQASIREVVDGVLAEVAEFAAARNAEVKVARVDDVSVACAPGVLLSIVSNLVRNGLKYLGDAPTRAVEIRASVAGANARIEVRDTGPGLPPDIESTLFEPYVRGTRTGEPGLGLGLATVKRLVEAHGGRVGVGSIAGEGCTFWLELPRVSASLG